MDSSRKQLKGIVLDSKMDKTAIVEVSRKISHPVYKKYIMKSKKYYAHDSDNKANPEVFIFRSMFKLEVLIPPKGIKSLFILRKLLNLLMPK